MGTMSPSEFPSTRFPSAAVESTCGIGRLGVLVPPAADSTGKERDAETGLDYFGARYLSSAQGRFSSPDEPLIDQHQSDPQSWNLYGYVRNNPLKFTDSTGQDCIYTNDYNSNGSVTVSNEQGSCSGSGGTYVAGTVDPSSLNVNTNNGTLNYAYTPYDSNSSYTYSNLELPDRGLQALQSAAQMAEPGVNLAGAGLVAFGSMAAPLPMALAMCGAGNCDKTNLAMAAIPDLGPLLEGASLARAARGLSAAAIYEKAGGFAQAAEDFKALAGTEKTIGPVKVKEFADGTKAVLRNFSKDGRATLEIQHATGEVTKIRYN